MGSETLCERCRKAISKSTRSGMARARARGAKIGRPRVVIPEAELARVRDGHVTAAELGKILGVSAITIRRRLR